MKRIKAMKSELKESYPHSKNNIITITRQLTTSDVYDLAKILARKKLLLLTYQERILQ